MSSNENQTPTCGIIATRQEQMLGYRNDGYFAECILPNCHRPDTHLVLTPEGKYMAWKDDYGCDCCCPEEDDRCTLFWEPDDTEIANLLRGDKDSKFKS